MSFFLVQGYEINPFVGVGGGPATPPVYPGQGLPNIPGLHPGGGPVMPPSTPSWGGGWGSGNRPDAGLPWAPGRPDNTLPGGSGAHPWLPGHGDGGMSPDNTLPGYPQPKAQAAAVSGPPPEKVDPSKGGWLLVSVPGHVPHSAPRLFYTASDLHRGATT
jgi:hypothetical protein